VKFVGEITILCYDCNSKINIEETTFNDDKITVKSHKCEKCQEEKWKKEDKGFLALTQSPCGTCRFLSDPNDSSSINECMSGQDVFYGGEPIKECESYEKQEVLT
jgi:hypothetical protein